MHVNHVSQSVHKYSSTLSVLLMISPNDNRSITAPTVFTTKHKLKTLLSQQSQNPTLLISTKLQISIAVF